MMDSCIKIIYFFIYRDKFLDGAPISSYNTSLIDPSQRIQTWMDRWYLYWLPALISKGLLPPSEKFIRILAWNLHNYELLIDRYKDLPGYNSTVFTDRTMSEKRLEVYGRFVVFQDAASKGYAYSDPIREFGNTTFTFVDFLKHVLWTNKLGLTDLHWMTFTQICDPCKYKYKYILSLENIRQESRYLLQQVLGYSETVALPSENRSKFFTKIKTDEEYFKDVPKDLVDKITDLYKIDFDLFNYRFNTAVS